MDTEDESSIEIPRMHVRIPNHTTTALVLRRMSSTDSQPSWTNPEYVATVVGVLATGALVFYSSLTQTGLTVSEIVFVILSITIPATIAYEIARRWS